MVNILKIGERIKKERMAAGFKTQDDLSAQLFEKHGIISRQEIGKWENGKKIPSMEILLTLCDLFQCDLGYLLCEYDCKTREKADIAEMTGLSENAIDGLLMICKENKRIMPALDFLLCSDNFTSDLLESLYNYALFEYDHLYAGLESQKEATSDLDRYEETCLQQIYMNEMFINKSITHITDSIRQAAFAKCLKDQEDPSGSRTFRENVKTFQDQINDYYSEKVV